MNATDFSVLSNPNPEHLPDGWLSVITTVCNGEHLEEGPRRGLAAPPYWLLRQAEGQPARVPKDTILSLRRHGYFYGNRLTEQGRAYVQGWQLCS
jgi:hypothetical protein